MSIRDFFASVTGRAFCAGCALAIVVFIFFKESPKEESVSDGPIEQELPHRFIEQYVLCDDDANLSHLGQESPERMAFAEKIFSEPFHFLGQGKQCAAYVSNDGNYVLKFILTKPFLSKKKRASSDSSQGAEREVKQVREKALLTSLSISSNLIPDETGCCFLHLNSMRQLQKKILLIDQRSSARIIDIDKFKWVLQKKARHIKLVLSELMWEGKIDQAKERIDQLFALLRDCSKKGIMDVDTGLIRNNNIGFLPDRAIYIDIGKLRVSPVDLPRAYFEKDIKRLIPLHKWLVHYYPVLGNYYEIRRQEMIAAH